MEILVIPSIVIEIKDTIDEIKNKMDIAEEGIGELKR